MKIKISSEQQILQEGLETLMNHLELFKVLRFIAACQLVEGDYLTVKDKLFEQETVASLSEKITDYQKSKL